MFRRSLVAVALAVVTLSPWSVRSAAAQERLEISNVDFTSSLLNASAVPAVRLGDRLADLELDQVAMPIAPVQFRKSSAGSAMLQSLYASTALMQALDVHSTLQAFKAGAVEGNPLMAGVAKNRGAFIATKAAVAVSTMLAVRQIAKRSKVAAVISAVAINSAYAMVVRHNYNLARGR